MKKSILENQKTIEKIYRPIPFWSWNDKLDPDLLRWQIREMEKAGLGGFFMHARGGLQTEYLGRDWMECVGACIDESKSTKMNAWLYDEDGWPSGFGGGKVTALGDKYHGRFLALSRFATREQLAKAEPKNLLGTYEYEGEILAVSHKSNPYYIDVMSMEAVAAFIECTHQEYYNNFEDEFQGTVKGFFTDEPRLSGDFEGDVPWSYSMQEEFSRQHGYDILENLDALFVKRDGYEKVRYDFYKCVNELFVNSFMKQIQAWCNEHNCGLTGHMMMEESIFTQMTGTAGVMPFYEYMDIPGIDWLRRTIGSPIVPKQLSSAAHQTGKKQTLTESFALTGWNVRMEELKWIIDWQLVNGVNLLCQHLEGYTLRGLRKRDYPPSLFYQLSWWEKYHLLNDYVSRIGKMLAESEYEADVLLIHPMRSGWVIYEGNLNDELMKLDDDFTASTELLSGLQIEYELGDESLISRHGKVAGSSLVIGEAKYSTVVLPPMVTIDENTLDMLNEFANNGGNVISIGSLPSLVSGKKDEAKLSFLKENTLSFDMYSDIDDIKKTFEGMGIRLCELTDIDTESDITEVHSRHFFFDGAECRLFVNHNQEETYDSQIALKGSGLLFELDTLTGELEKVESTQDGSFIKTKAVFEPMQSRLFVIVGEKEAQEAEYKVAKSSQDEDFIVTPAAKWDIEKMSDNAITFDACSYKIDDGSWQEPKAVIHIFNELLELKRACDITLKFNFDIDCDVKSLEDAFLVVESADEFIIEVNGSKVEYVDDGYWLDSSFLKVQVGTYLKNGANEIILKRDFYQSDNVYHVLFDEGVYETELNKLTYDVELESIYLVGGFGVKSMSEYTSGEREACFSNGPFVLTEPPTTTTGNMTVESMPFFTGQVTLCQDITVSKKENQSVLLHLERPSAAVSEVIINGKLIKALPWAPYDVDITDYVVEGKNKLSIRLYSGNRNLLGPHHHIDGELYNVGPDSFTGKWSWVEKSSEANPATQEDRERSYWNDRYCFVRFGIN